jgi:lipopolysaccharide export system protein LptA
MARGPGHRPLILLRWILLGLLLLAGAAVLRIYLGRDNEPTTPRSVTTDSEGSVESGDSVMEAEGFEYEVIDEGVTLFFISADRMASDRQDRFALEGVELRMEEDGDLYTIASSRAIYDLDSRDATLEGSVVMSGPDGIELRGEQFILRHSGRVLESTTGPVDFLLPGAYTGTATGVRINLHLNSLLLREGVVIDSPAGAEPRVRLVAQRILYRQEESLLRSEGGVEFSRGDDRLRSERLSLSFDSAGGGLGSLRFIQAKWQVSGRIALDSNVDRSALLEFEAATMGVAIEAAGDQVESVVLEGGAETATMRLDDGAGLRQTLRADSIFTGFAEGMVSRLETYVPTILDEALALPGAPALRRLCGDSLSARIGQDGALADVQLDGLVDYREARLSASGDLLEGDPEGELKLSGKPARLISGDDDVEASEIVYSRDGGSLLATGGVRASGLDRSGVELASGDDRAPVQVTADQATWIDQPPEIAFEGKVRAWQGESFLLANRLRILEEGERLVGEGAVKTVWRPHPDDAEARQPIEVNAEQFTYLRQEGRLNYSQSVRAHEAGRAIRCEDLEILMDTDRRIESLLCEGDAVVEDPINGRTVRGSEALYTPGDRMVLITGAPVILEQRDGAAMEGRRLRYDLDTGEVRIVSEPRTSGPEAELAEPLEPVDG